MLCAACNYWKWEGVLVAELISCFKMSNYNLSRPITTGVCLILSKPPTIQRQTRTCIAQYYSYMNCIMHTGIVSSLYHTLTHCMMNCTMHTRNVSYITLCTRALYHHCILHTHTHTHYIMHCIIHSRIVSWIVPCTSALYHTLYYAHTHCIMHTRIVSCSPALYHGFYYAHTHCIMHCIIQHTHTRIVSCIVSYTHIVPCTHTLYHALYHACLVSCIRERAA